MSPTTDAWFDAAHGLGWTVSWLDAGQTGKTVGGGDCGVAYGGIARRASQPTTPTYAAPKSPRCMIACDHGSLPQRFGPTQ